MQKKIAVICCMALAVGWSAMGCQKAEDSSEPVQQLEEKEPVTFVSAGGALSIMLPDDSWSTDEDTEDLCMFSSDAGMIMLTRMNEEAPILPESAHDLKIILQKEGYNSENFEVLEYEDWKIAEMTSYRSVIKYKDSKSTYSYGILYTAILGQQEYMASAMLFAEDEDQLERVKQSIYSFKVLQVPTEDKADEEPAPEAAAPEPAPEATPEPVPEPMPEAAPEPAAPEPAPPADQGAVTGTRVCKAAAYVRSGPNNSSSVVGTVVEGEVISVISEVSNWYEISYAGTVAYVCKDYVQ